MLWSEVAKTYAAIFQEKITISELAKVNAYDSGFAKGSVI